MKIISFSLGAVVLLASTVLTAGPALAAPPSNDTYDGRVSVPALPFTDERSTLGATTDAEDSAINASCGAPVTGASVWYEYVAPSAGAVLVDVSASDYSTGVLVATGSPGSWSFVTCGARVAAWQATAGTAYAVVVFDDQRDGPDAGGNLVLSMSVTELPTIEATVDAAGTFNGVTGEAMLTGTVRCTGERAEGILDITLTQRIGNLKVLGFGGTPVTCDGAVRPWSALLASPNGYFDRGEALAAVTANVCTDTQVCGETYLVEQPTRLRSAEVESRS
jgi:hypothetical protein